MEIETYLNPLRKWWWLIALATLLAGGASYLATRQQPLFYESRTTLVIGRTIEDPNPSNAALVLSEQLSAYYADIALREPVRNATREALGLTSLPSLTVRALPGTQLLEIVVVDTNPQRSQAVANELANQLIRLSPGGLQPEEQERQAFVKEQLDDLQAQIEATQAEIEAKQGELGELFSAQQIADTQNQLEALRSKLGTLHSTYAALLTGSDQGATNALTIIEPAHLPQAPVDPNIEISILIAAAMGFAIATAATYLLEYLDDTVKTPNTITKLTNLPTLAGIAKVGTEDSRLVTVSRPRAPTSEAFRVLRTALQFSGEDTDNYVLLVTSSTPEEGKSTIASNLAVVIAQAGYKVVLADADLRRPTQHQVFDLPNKRGLTSLLLESHAAELDAEALQKLVGETVQPTRIAGLQVLTSGPVPPNPSELLGSNKMEVLLDTLEKEFDFVILDSPPVLSVTDAVILSSKADGTLLVVKADRSRREHLRQGIERLREVNANMVGCVLNALSPRSEGYKFYYYYQDPYYSHNDEDEADAQGGGPGLTAKLRKRFLRSQTA